MKRALLLIFLATLLAGCAAPKQFYTITPNIDYSTLTLYGWDKMLALDADTKILVKNAVKSDLQTKGFKLAKNVPNLKVSAMLTTHTNSEMNYDFGFNYDKPVEEPGLIRGKRRDFDEKVLVIAFTPEGSDDPTWQGSAPCDLTGTSSPHDKRIRIDTAVTSILSKFPPQ